MFDTVVMKDIQTVITCYSFPLRLSFGECLAKICPITILYYSTDFELVILVSLTHTYCLVMILQPVSLVEFHLQ